MTSAPPTCAESSLRPGAEWGEKCEAAIAAGGYCLAHLPDDELAAHLSEFTPEAPINARNVVFTAALLSQLLESICSNGVPQLGRADFSGATFTENADFYSAKFTKNADFSSATFTQDTDFDRVVFTKNADFSTSTFTQKTDFRGAAFAGNTNFYRATFTQDVYFSEATFTRYSNFINASFTQDASFPPKE